MAREDYSIMTYGTNRPLKEKDAIRSVEDNWSKTNISRLRYRSNGEMAIKSITRQDKSYEKAAEETLKRARGEGHKPKNRSSSDIPKRPTGKGTKQATLFSLTRSNKKKSSSKRTFKSLVSKTRRIGSKK